MSVLCVCVSEDRSQNSYLYKLESLCHSFLCQSLVEADDRRRRVLGGVGDGRLHGGMVDWPQRTKTVHQRTWLWFLHLKLF